MTRRSVLLKAVKGMFLFLILAFLYVLFRSLSGPSMVTNPAKVFDDIQVGQTGLRRYQGERVWVTRLSSQQKTQADEVAEFVLDAESGCSATLVLCAVSAKTLRDGIEITFSQSAPVQIPSDVPWYGGFVNPNSDAVYDRLGRPYRVNSSRGSAKQVEEQSIKGLPVITIGQ